MLLIAGLGNPGARYEGTRHNIGFDVLDFVGRDCEWQNSRKLHAQTAVLANLDQKVLLAKPQTFMNESGRSIAALCQKYKIRPQNILVVHDELDIPLGKMKIKCGGGDGGHNGLRSITAAIGRDYNRLRVGIGRPYGTIAVVDFVLSVFEKEKQPLVAETISKAAKVVNLWKDEGLVATQRVVGQIT